MSTRCQIGFYKADDDAVESPEVLIYRHSDGYPESEYGVLATLIPLIKYFDERRGYWDVHYLSAFVVAQLKGNDIYNIGICGDRQLHGDIEFYYAVYPSCVVVHTVSLDYPEFPTLKFQERVSLREDVKDGI
jgi:hypothetical protein